MCGIAGFWDESNSLESLRTIENMLEAISHRGPDSRDTYRENKIVLGHNRLSIIDIEARSDQPMHYQDCVLVYNGEVYNYIELRKELKKAGYNFTTDSDSEVVIAAYKYWGENCVQHFVGMWAFVIWDKTKQKFFCSRDRFGIKPFYYISYQDKFYFASEIKALKYAPIFDRELNIDQVYRYIQLGWTHFNDETFYKNIKSLPAAHNATLDNKGLSINRYWDINFQNTIQGTLENKVQDFKELMLESIKLHLRSDVEIGGCLSGGIDSSVIASVIGKEYPNIEFKNFTIYYDGKGDVDERSFAKKVTDSHNNLVPFYYKPTDDDLVEHFDKYFYHQDIPPAGSSAFSQYFVMRLASQKGIKVVLDGQGADEYLVGYMHSFYRFIGEHLMSKNMYKGMKYFKEHANIQGYKSKEKINRFLKSILGGVWGEQKLYAYEYKNYFPFLPKNEDIPFQLSEKGNSRLDQFLYQLIYTTSLPQLLTYEDRNSMAFSIESRVPFLDHRLIEFCFGLNDRDKIHKGITKHILREAMKSYLPKEIYNRTDKKGFVTPGEEKWLRGPLKHLLKFDYKNFDIVNTHKLKEVIMDYEKGNNKNAKFVWRLASLQKWLNEV